MPSPLDKNRQQHPEAENDKSFTGNEEKQVEIASESEESAGNQDETHRDAYKSRNLEIEKERD